MRVGDMRPDGKDGGGAALAMSFGAAVSEDNQKTTHCYKGYRPIPSCSPTPRPNSLTYRGWSSRFPRWVQDSRHNNLEQFRLRRLLQPGQTDRLDLASIL